MSEALASVPMVSKSHWTNSRYRPRCVFSRPPDRGNVIALEGEGDLAQVLGREARKGDGQVKPHGDVPFPLHETEQLLV